MVDIILARLYLPGWTWQCSGRCIWYVTRFRGIAESARRILELYKQNIFVLLCVLYMATTAMEQAPGPC